MFFTLNSKIDALCRLTYFFCLIWAHLIFAWKNFRKFLNLTINLSTFFIFFFQSNCWLLSILIIRRLNVKNIFSSSWMISCRLSRFWRNWFQIRRRIKSRFNCFVCNSRKRASKLLNSRSRFRFVYSFRNVMRWTTWNLCLFFCKVFFKKKNELRFFVEDDCNWITFFSSNSFEKCLNDCFNVQRV